MQSGPYLSSLFTNAEWALPEQLVHDDAADHAERSPYLSSLSTMMPPTMQSGKSGKFSPNEGELGFSGSFGIARPSSTIIVFWIPYPVRHASPTNAACTDSVSMESETVVSYPITGRVGPEKRRPR